METTYTAEELYYMGFELVNDGGEYYFQKVDNKEDYFNSTFEYTEEVGVDSYVIRKG